MRRSSALVFVLPSIWFLGCGDDAPATQGAAGGAAGSSGSAATAGSGGSGSPGGSSGQSGSSGSGGSGTAGTAQGGDAGTSGTAGESGSSGTSGTSGSSGSGGSAGTGATAGSGGTGAIGGTGGTGATAGTGGNAGTGAMAGAGGTGATGAMAGTGGTGGTGAIGGTAGSAGSSGTSGSAGSGGSGGLNIDPTPIGITPGMAGKYLLKGMVVPVTSAPFVGEVLVEGEKITCVQPGSGCDAMASGATILDTHGIIAPGFIDIHNHILYDVLDEEDWDGKSYDAGTPWPFSNINQWKNDPRYQAMLDVKQCLAFETGKPTWCNSTSLANGNVECEMNKFGELKALIAGTTSVIAHDTSRACYGSLSRTLGGTHNDLKRNGANVDSMNTSATFPPSTYYTCDGLGMSDTTWVMHCGEGVDASAKNQFQTFINNYDPAPIDCAYKERVALTHGSAFTPAEFDVMHTLGLSLVWSPKSNVSLYDTTTNIPAALDAGLLISIAPDWSMGGSQNLMDEVRFADAWDKNAHGANPAWDRLTPQMLIEMVTINPAKAIHYDDLIGSLEVGKYADLFVADGDATQPYESLVATSPVTNRMTMLGGQIYFGDAGLKSQGANAMACEDLPVCGRNKFVCVAETSSTTQFNQSYSDIITILNAKLDELDLATTSQYKAAPLPPVYRCP